MCVIGIKQELQTEKELLESQYFSSHGPSSTRNQANKSPGSHTGSSVGPPSLARKSAPSSIVVEALKKEEQLLKEKLKHRENLTNATKKLYSRDKWWRKFSSANLNVLSNEIEKEHGKDTYIPQFDIAGGDHYIKQHKTVQD
eukprot:g1978.t1